jgi:hypothetical protein
LVSERQMSIFWSSSMVLLPLFTMQVHVSCCHSVCPELL